MAVDVPVLWLLLLPRSDPPSCRQTYRRMRFHGCHVVYIVVGAVVVVVVEVVVSSRSSSSICSSSSSSSSTGDNTGHA